MAPRGTEAAGEALRQCEAPWEVTVAVEDEADLCGHNLVTLKHLN